jgi:hypothetical protein
MIFYVCYIKKQTLFSNVVFNVRDLCIIYDVRVHLKHYLPYRDCLTISKSNHYPFK